MAVHLASWMSHLLLLLLHWDLAVSFSTPLCLATWNLRVVQSPLYQKSFLLSTLVSSGDATESSSVTAYQSIFNFTNTEERAVEKFDRIDDAIMGGISLSSIKQLDNENFARWSGVCRTDGGGFCGTRTMPFQEPLQLGEDAQGFYLLCRFTSDDEPQRRVWKMTTRAEDSRGEQLYQAMFEIPHHQTSTSEELQDVNWQRILVPFENFKQVRGPRLVEGAAPLNVTGGLFQIGVSLSKFLMGTNVTELFNFRPGYFELEIKEIGVYSSQTANYTNVATAALSLLHTPNVQTLSKEEARKKQPVLLKFLSPLTNVLFSEKARRRQSAIRILRKKGLSRWQVVKYAFRNRVERMGLMRAILETVSVCLQDSLRMLVGTTLRFLLIAPLFASLRLVRIVKHLFKKQPRAEDGV